MTSRWSKLEDTVDNINTLALQNNISLRSLRNPATSEGFIKSTAQYLMSTMRNNLVTGIFIVLDVPTDNGDGTVSRPGLYIVGPNFLSGSLSPDNSDLLIKRGSPAICQQLGIGTDTSWKPMFSFDESNPDSQKYFNEPISAARLNPDFELRDMGYWSEDFRLGPSDSRIVTYSVPLVNSHGIVYGVAGIEVSAHYLEEAMPYHELSDAGNASYSLGFTTDNGESFRIVAASGQSPVELDSGAANITLSPYSGIFF